MTMQWQELTATTDQFGQIEATFPNDIDKITATLNSVNDGQHSGNHSLKAWVNGSKAAAARVENSSGPLANSRITVTFIAGNG